MAHINEIGDRFYTQSLFWHIDRPPLVHLTKTSETEPPFRVGTSLVLRVPFTKRAFVLGAWTSKAPTEEEALLNSMGARVTKGNGTVLDGEVDW